MSMSGKLLVGLAAGLCAGTIVVPKIVLHEPAKAPGAKSGARNAIELVSPGTRRMTLRPHRPLAPQGDLGDEARDADRTKELEALAEMNPLRALAWAEAEPDSELREPLLQTILQTWGAVDPCAAIHWARTQHLMDFTQAITSVFQGAARDPDGAVRLAQLSAEQDPEHARDYGASLVAAFGNNGDFHRAAAFAAESAESSRLDVLTVAYAAWADKAPLEALDYVAQLSPATRRDAFKAIISRWTTTDARSVADYALTLESKEDRAFALSAALRTWSADEAAEAAEWLDRQAPAPELDVATAALASHPDTLSTPAAALSLAESITDRSLKTRVLATVLNRWATTDAVLARSYADALADLSSDDLSILNSAFASDFEPVSFLP